MCDWTLLTVLQVIAGGTIGGLLGKALIELVRFLLRLGRQRRAVAEDEEMRRPSRAGLLRLKDAAEANPHPSGITVTGMDKDGNITHL